MAYVTADEVNTYLGESLSDEALDAAAELVEAASDFVDRYTGRTWVAGTVTGEIQMARNGIITLDRAPISGVTTVTKEGIYLGATVTTLTAPTGYRIVNAPEGQLLVNAVDGDLIRVTYTAAPTVPDDIKAAAKMLVAGWVQSAGDPSGLNLSKLKAGTVELTYRDAVEVAPSALAILNAYRSGFVFA